jgi:hypothetical protein
MGQRRCCVVRETTTSSASTAPRRTKKKVFPKLQFGFNSAIKFNKTYPYRPIEIDAHVASGTPLQSKDDIPVVWSVDNKAFV